MTTTQKTAAIRAQLKAQGITSRQVSVRRTSAGSIHICILDASAVSKRQVEAVAMPYERIDRCTVTDEILAGGNTFVIVEYARRTPASSGQYRPR